MQTIENTTELGECSPELPLLATILQYVPIRTIQDFVNADNEVQRFAEETMRRVGYSGIKGVNMFSSVVAENEKENATLADYQVAFEAAGFIVAGPGTTAVTFTYIIGAVLSNRAMQAKLEAEVEALPEPYTE
ncbi:cytochrome P450 [Seiridium cupressi]